MRIHTGGLTLREEFGRRKDRAITESERIRSEVKEDLATPEEIRISVGPTVNWLKERIPGENPKFTN